MRISLPAAGRMNGESTAALKQAETENGLQISSDNAILKSMTGLQEHFFAGAVTLGDILESAGYCQNLMIGSDATFGGRRLYFKKSYETDS